MIKSFEQFLNESLNSTFTVVSRGDLKEALGDSAAEKISMFFGNSELVFFSDEDEGLARKVGHEIWNLVSSNHPRYFTHTEYRAVNNVYSPVKSKTFQFYNNPAKGISKLVLVDDQPISFLVLKDELENFSGLISAKRYGI